MMPLILVPTSSLVEIVNVLGGRGLRRKLLTMGIIPGSVWRIAQNLSRGPVVLEKDGMRIGIGHGMAAKILVRIMR